MTETVSDAALARRAASGDRAAFAALYDRFAGEVHGFAHRLLRNEEDAADVTQDVFVRAVERLGQLREPERVRAWLFAIARHECYARTRRRSRSTPSDPMDHAFDLDSGERSTAGRSEARELGELVWSAAAGLTPEDRAVLELKLRDDLDGPDLADALGVPRDHLHKVVGRAVERFERSVVALVLARGARKDCPELASIVGAEAELTPVLRKRIARHVEDCDTCERRRKVLVNPASMAASAATPPLPSALRDRVLDAMASGTPSGTSASRYRWRADGFPAPRPRRWKVLGAAAAGGLLLVGGTTAGGLLGDDGDGSTVEVRTPVATAPSPSTTVPATTAPFTTAPPPTTPITTSPPTTAPITTAPSTTATPTTAPITTAPFTTTAPVAPVGSAIPTAPPATRPATTRPTTTRPTTTRKPTTTRPPTTGRPTTTRKPATNGVPVADPTTSEPPATTTTPPAAPPVTDPLVVITVAPADPPTVVTVPATTTATNTTTTNTTTPPVVTTAAPPPTTTTTIKCSPTFAAPGCPVATTTTAPPQPTTTIRIIITIRPTIVIPIITTTTLTIIR